MTCLPNPCWGLGHGSGCEGRNSAGPWTELASGTEGSQAVRLEHSRGSSPACSVES